MTDFDGADLRESRFENSDLSGAQFSAVDLSHARFRGVDLTGAVMRGADARPSLDVALELRHDRMSTMREFIDGLADATLDGHTEPVEGPGWPQPRSYPVRQCLLVILNEEWEHRLYAERDLAILAADRGYPA